MNYQDSKAPSPANMQRQGSLQHGELDSAPGTPRSNRFTVTRTPSTNTVTQTRFLASPRQPNRSASGTPGRQLTPKLPKEPSQDDDDESGLGVDRPIESESEEETSVVRSQAFRRPQFSERPTTATLSSDGDVEDDEEDSSGGYLPFAAPAKSSKEDPAATLRNSPKRHIATPHLTSTIKGRPKEEQEQPPDSSESSASSAQLTTTTNTRPETNNRPGTLSPRHRAELEKLSPRYKKSGSEGSPSIGSSFSDLDDASVTQSALEDALMSS